MKRIINNEITLDPSGVWRLSDGQNIQYSDGQVHERYLEKVFSKVTDVSSSSSELKQYIRDWPSEYHLSHRRSQLLNGFTYNRQARVLEVGCGCGAITRFLGETFDQVISIEGSFTRAKLARRRTADLENVSILSAPFQEISFNEKFDLIFCIGVFEYSNTFVNAEDPYDNILQYFRSLLNKEGVLLLAIENQFGLKYFSSCSEDHSQFMFDGIEDYPHLKDGARTFGYHEIKSRLQPYFSDVLFYFPYPDYKIPDCVLSEQLFSRVDASELISRIESRDYLKEKNPLFNESLANKALARNNMLPFFANSFLIMAGSNSSKFVHFNQLGILYGTDRSHNFQTLTHIIEDNGKKIFVEKRVIHPAPSNSREALSICSLKDPWRQGESVHSLVARKILHRRYEKIDVFYEAGQWLDYIHTQSSMENGILIVDGKFIDCIWQNVIISNGVCYYIDAELIWHKPIPVSVLLVRTIYHFLEGIQSMTGVEPIFARGRRVSRIRRIAATLGIKLSNNDFKQFLHIEAGIEKLVHGYSEKKAHFYIRNQLMGFGVYSYLLNIKRKMLRVIKS